MNGRRTDKYGRGSAAANGEGFVDLAPGDTFAALEEQLRRRIADRFDNLALGISASICSKRNANELAKHLAYGEGEEAHKFAAYLRVFSAFVFAGRKYLATITLKEVSGESGNIYAVEALEINQDADSEVHLAEQCPKGLNSAPIQNLASQLAKRIAYYVGDVNRTRPAFVNRNEPFTIDRCAVVILEKLGRDGYAGG